MSRGFYIWLLATMLAALALAPLAVSADAFRGQFLVSVTVVGECNVSMPNMDIDESTTVKGTAMVRGTVALNCSKNTAYDISLGSGVNSPGTPVPASVSGVGNGAPQMMPVFYRVSARTSEANGVSARILTMTITY